MDYLYAQIDEDGICVGLSQLAGEVDAPHMVRLSEAEYQYGELMGKRHVNGVWEAISPADEL